ncbi:MAG: DUF362 domain-containing protein [Candidatus Acidiferrales bacterium]
MVRLQDHDKLDGGFRFALEQVPGLLPHALPKQVVIKPNVCDITSWETGVTTDPRWLTVVAREIRSIRPDAEIRVVESDAISAYKSYRSCDESFERLGFVSAAQEAGVELVNLSRSESIEIRLDGLPLPLRIPQLFLEEMYFISIANLKVHPYTRMTGILKNSLGLLSDADISSLHPYLSTLISRLYLLCPPDLCIIDGRIGLEGKGPIMGDPVRMDTLLVGSDALVVDEAASLLMGIRPKAVPHLRQVARDFGRTIGDFEVVGHLCPRAFAFDTAEAFPAIQTKFASRRLHQRMEDFSRRWIDRAFRFKEDPCGFARSAVSKLARGRRER